MLATVHTVYLSFRKKQETFCYCLAEQYCGIHKQPCPPAGKTVSSEPAMVPMDTCVEVGHKLTLCCITTEEEPVMSFNGTRAITRIGDHSYTITVHIQEPLPLCTVSAFCTTSKYGTCVYAGCEYKPPFVLPRPFAQQNVSCLEWYLF